jgi:hypothetical protein
VPTLVDSQRGYTSGAHNASVTITPAAGDVLVLKGANTWQWGQLDITAAGGQTWTLQAAEDTPGQGLCRSKIWTAVSAGSGGITLTVTDFANAGTIYMLVEVWRNADLAGSPAFSQSTGSGSPSDSITTAGDGSAVSWLATDSNAINPATKNYFVSDASPVEEDTTWAPGVGQDTFTGYSAYHFKAAAGSDTFGVSSPVGQLWTLLGVEVLDVPSGAPGDSTSIYDRQPWH